MESNVSIKQRDLIALAFLVVITFGFYYIYWLVSTKNELNRLGAAIPTAWLLIIPIANIYFLYKYAQGFAQFILKQESSTVSYFLLLSIFPYIAIFIIQSHFNQIARSR